MKNILEIQFNRLKEIFYTSKKSKFYNDKYRNIKSVKSVDDFISLPFLTRQELYDNTYPKSMDMLTQDLESMIVLSTGGSSGIARYTLMTHNEWEKFADKQAFAIKLLGVNSKDIVANLLVAGSLWPSFVGIHDVIKKVGATHLPISANIDLDKIIDFCMEFQPTALFSLPTLFVFLADKMKQKGAKFKRLKLIAYGGEHMSKEVREYLFKTLEVKEIKSMAYSSADAGLMGYQCEHCKPNEYHLPVDFQAIEIFNFDKNRHCEPEEKGEIIVTNLARLSMPIIRYRLGDLASFNSSPCKCGDSNPLFSLHGRAGEDFKLGGAYISMGVFESAIGEIAGENSISLNYQLTIEDVENKMNINLKVEAGDIEKAKLSTEKLKNILKQNIPEIEKGLDLNFIKTFNIDFVKLGSLERSPITGKVKKLIDKRVVE
jgi:phenylacetate-CoA ligase